MTTLFYLIMKDGDNRRWWDGDEDKWTTRKNATRFRRIHDSILPPGGRWVGPCDGSEL